PRLSIRMTAERRLRARKERRRDPDAACEQTQAALQIAKQRNIRTKTVAGLDADRKARHLAAVSELSEALAARVLLVYHMAEQRPMMGTFLDRKSTRLNSSHQIISYAVFCLKKKRKNKADTFKQQ